MPRDQIVNLEPIYAVDAPQEITFKVKLPEGAQQVQVALDDACDEPLVLITRNGAGTADPHPPWGEPTGTGAKAALSESGNELIVTLEESPPPGRHTLLVTTTIDPNAGLAETVKQSFKVVRQRDVPEIIAEQGSLPVSLQARASQRVPDEEVIWIRILAASRALGFEAYRDYVKENFCNDPSAPEVSADGTLMRRRPARGVRAYEHLKRITEQFMHETCERLPRKYVRAAVDEAINRLERLPEVNRGELNNAIPQNLLVVSGRLPRVADAYELACLKPDNWCPVELIWSFWMEAGMLSQTMHVIARRFQNLRVGNGRDPLANFEVAPLRALNHFLFGYVQDDDRLTVLRRNYEYKHQYGLQLQGRAIGRLRPADNRSKFLESFHNLLLRCIQFYRQVDDLTVRADAFPVLNALKETHYLAAVGAHNQIGELPQLARQEMLIEQWLLGTSEMRDFLHAREMVPYPEDWMEKVDAMKSIQGWIDTSVIHFRDLAIASEIIVLSVRFGGWAAQNDAAVAATWATLFRGHIQTYLHAYRAVTGVDLTSDTTNPRHALLRAASPSEHLQRRWAEQSARQLR